jgi:hypothetical protein
MRKSGQDVRITIVRYVTESQSALEIEFKRCNPDRNSS